MSNFFEEAKDLVEQHPDQAKEAVDKLEGLVNEKTDGKYEGQVSEGADKLEGMLGLDNQ